MDGSSRSAHGEDAESATKARREAEQEMLETPAAP
jgi:hypothetical protein